MTGGKLCLSFYCVSFSGTCTHSQRISSYRASCLCFVFPGFCALPVLTQPPSASASLGASVKLTCTLSREHSNYYVLWYQQQTGKAPRYLMKVNSDGSHSKGDGIPSRFSGSSSGVDRYLTISNIQSEDEADPWWVQSWGVVRKQNTC
uniref:Ig-like domain-containing protein n=1 Tax=Neovison vison TaxID=452646 RepID=A0A8C7B622_NEOVI